MEAGEQAKEHGESPEAGKVKVIDSSLVLPEVQPPNTLILTE